jgi:hypothetical protein
MTIKAGNQGLCFQAGGSYGTAQNPDCAISSDPRRRRISRCALSVALTL